MSEGGNESRKQVGTLFLELDELKRNIEEADKLLKSIGTGINLNMSDIVKKQVKDSLDLLVRETKNAAQKTKDSTQQMNESIGSFGAQLQVVERQTKTWSGKTLQHLSVVKKGFIDGKEVSQVFRDGKLSKVQVVDVDKQQEAKRLYGELIDKILELKEERIALAKMNKSDPDYANQEKKVKTIQDELAYLEASKSSYSQQLQIKSRLVEIDKQKAQVDKEVAKVQKEVANASELEKANGLYVVQKKNLEDLVSAWRNLVNAKTEAEQRSAMTDFDSAANQIKLTEAEIALLDAEILKKSDILKLDKERANAEKQMDKISADKKKEDVDALKEAMSKETELLKERLRLTKELQSATSEENKSVIGKRIAEIKKEVSERRKIIDAATTQAKAEVDLNKHLHNRWELEKNIAGIEPVSIKDQQKIEASKTLEANYLRQISLLEQRLKLVKDIEKASPENRSGFETLLTDVDKELQVVREIVGQLEEEGVVTSRNVELKERQLSLEQQISAIVNKPKYTDKDADKAATDQVNLYKQLYKLEEDIARTKDEKTRKALEAQKEDTLRLIKEQEELVKKIKEEVGERGKLQTLEHDLAALRARHDQNMNIEPLERAKKAYKQQEDANRDYIAAVKNGDTSRAESAKKVATTQQQILEDILRETSYLDENNFIRKEIVQTIDRMKKSIEMTANAEKDYNDKLEKSTKTVDTMLSQLRRFVSIMTVLNGLRRLWKNAWEYSKTYYDSQNEIRIVTGLAEEEAERMGESYRKLAKDMNVSSSDIASGAVEFWRQGLDSSNVNARLVETTKYAKISGLEFQEAAEQVTAATNSMNLDADRVVDVFAYLGDASASGADEIGVAMQKASAAAEEFGLSFEWLGTYIATISEKTRLAPEVIGTSINSIQARLHSIKQTGYNSEDETKINDISKALNEVGISLMDNQNQWRDLSDIFNDVADVWGTQDSKTRSYIATTMAGTRQQNYFLTLMNDLAKGVEGGSRAWDLYVGSMTSAGAATEKYAVWQESVTAAQNNWKVALEELYSLMDADWMKGFYNDGANLIRFFKDATDTTEGLNIKLPIAAGGIVALATAFVRQKASIDGTVTASALLKAVWTKHPVGLILSGIGVAIGAISFAAGMIETTAEKYEKAVEKMEAANTEIEKIKSNQESLVSTFTEQASKTNKTAAENKQLESVLGKIAEVSPRTKEAVDKYTKGLIGQDEVIKTLIDDTNRLIDNQETLSKDAAKTALQNWTIDSDEYERPTSSMSFDDLNSFFGLYGYDGTLKSLEEAMQKWQDDSWKAYDKFSGTDLFDRVTAKFNEWDWEFDGDYNAIAAQMEQSAIDGDKQFNQWQDELKTKIHEAINMAVNYVGSSASTIERGYLQNVIMEQIMASDGDSSSISREDLQEAGTIAWDSVVDYLKADADSAAKRSQGILSEFVKTVYGEDADEVSNQLELLGDTAGLGEVLSSRYEELLAQGLNSIEIQKIFDKSNLSEQIGMGVNSLLGDALKTDFNIDVNGFSWGENGVEKIDAEAKTIIYRLLETGTSVEKVQEVFANTNSLESFKDALMALNVELFKVDENAPETLSIQEQLDDATSRIEALLKVREALAEGATPEDAGITELIEHYPYLLEYMNNRVRLQGELEALTQAEEEHANALWRSWAGQNETLANTSPFASQLNETITTLDSLKAHLVAAGDIEGANKVEAYLNSIAKAASKAKSSVDAYGEAKNKALRAQNLVDAVNTIDPTSGTTDQTALFEAYDTIDNTFGEKLKGFVRGTEGYFLQAKKLAEEARAEADRTAKAFGILNEARLKSTAAAATKSNERKASEMEKKGYDGAFGYLIDEAEDARKKAISELGQRNDYDTLTTEERAAIVSDAIEDTWNRALHDLDDIGLLEPMAEMFGDVGAIAEECGYDIEAIIQKIIQMKEEAADTDLHETAEALREERSSNYASSDGYTSELDDLTESFETGGVEGLMDAYSGLDDKIRSGLIDTYKSLAIAMDDANEAIKEHGEGSEEATRATKKLERELKKAQKQTDSKKFKNTAKAIADLEHGTIDVSEAMETYADEMETVREAQEEYDEASKKIAKGSKVAAEDLENLAEFMGGVDPDWLIQNWDQVGPALTNALAEGEDAFRSLQEAAFIHITGTSDVDFSTLENGLLYVQDQSDEAVQKLIDLGLFKVEYKDVAGWADVYENNKIVRKKLTGNYPVLVPTGDNPLKRRGGGSTARKSSGSGGGGSSSSKDNGPSEIEKMLDAMEQVQDFQDHRRSLFSAAAGLYEGRGEQTNAITMYKKEMAVVEQQTKTLQENVAEVEKFMLQKQAEVAAMSTSDEAYEQAASDLKALQERHQEYTLQLIENEAAVDDLTQAIKDQQDKIRDMEIDLRDTILQAIEDREELQERMLQGTIDTENEILDLLTKRYEKERDDLLELAELKRDALQEEMDLLDEQLEKRKQLSEEQDKAKQLAELQAKQARISADPTRKKEELELREQIAELREEIAWDQAEQETEAQKESLEDQITNVEDYMEYVEAYYEDLFAHPKKLIDEMNEIIQKTDKEIIDWLSKNSEDFAASTENTQKDMVNSWQQMLDDMHGNITTYWDEVESIIQQGDEAIIEFLKQNSADYRAASKLQAEAYVDEWKQKLEDLKRAFLNNAKEINSIEYQVVQPSTGSGSSGSGGSSSGGGGSSKPRMWYVVTSDGKTKLSEGYSTEQQAASKRASERNYWYNSWQGALASHSSTAGSYETTYYKWKNADLKQFIKGGIVDFTGPAWVDGTKTRPEAFLNANQTEMIGHLAQALEEIRVHVPTMPQAIVDYDQQRDGLQVSGDLIIQVEKLETEEDIEKMVELVKETFYKDLSRSSAVGGIKLR